MGRFYLHATEFEALLGRTDNPTPGYHEAIVRNLASCAGFKFSDVPEFTVTAITSITHPNLFLVWFHISCAVWWGMSKSDSNISVPKSMRHKRILDVAEDKPDASMEELAEGVPSATADLVENVLETYGDPAVTEPETPPDSEIDESGGSRYPDEDSLSSIQRETLQAILEHPEATQRELGDLLEVSPATISNRVNSIPHFDWGDRTRFATTVLTNPPTTDDKDPNPPMTNSNGTDTTTSMETDIPDHVRTMEDRIEGEETDTSEDSAFVDSKFAYKVLRACIESEDITEEEERRLFFELHQ